jgi:membrane protease YdiL (CAAX protease family)
MNSSPFKLFPSDWKNANSSYLLLVIIFLCLMIASILASFSMLLAHEIWGFSIKELPNLTSRIEEHSVLRCLQMLQTFSSVGLFLIPPLAFIYITKLRFFSFKKFPPVVMALVGIFLMWCLLPIINFSAEWNASIQLPAYFDSLMQWIHEKETEANLVATGFLKMDNLYDLLLSLLIIAIIPAIGEEFLFRGTIQPILQKIFNNPHWAIWISAFIFSFIHFQFLGFLPRFLIGGFLGYLFYWSGSIWLAVLAHFVNNATAVVVYYLYQHNFIQQTTDDLGTGEYTWIELIVSIILIVFGLRYIYLRTLIKSPPTQIQL